MKLSALCLAVLAVLLSLTAPPPATAQPPAMCELACGRDTVAYPWTYKTYNVEVKNGSCELNVPSTRCIVTAGYRFRKSCANPFYEIEILSLSWDKPCFPNKFDPVPLIKAVTWGLLAENPMHFPPNLDDTNDRGRCAGNYTVKAASCWKNYPGQKAAITCAPSQGEACCYGGYQVCWTEDPITHRPRRSVGWMFNNTLDSTCTDSCISSCKAFEEDGIFNRRLDDTPHISCTQPAPATATVAPTEAPAATRPRDGTNQKKQR